MPLIISELPQSLPQHSPLSPLFFGTDVKLHMSNSNGSLRFSVVEELKSPTAAADKLKTWNRAEALKHELTNTSLVAFLLFDVCHSFLQSREVKTNLKAKKVESRRSFKVFSRVRDWRLIQLMFQFGVSLDTVDSRHLKAYSAPIPSVLIKLENHLFANGGLDHVGIFRLGACVVLALLVWIFFLLQLRIVTAARMPRRP